MTTEETTTTFYPQRPLVNQITHLVSNSGSVLIFNSNMKLVYEYLYAWFTNAPHIPRYNSKQDNIEFTAWVTGLSVSAVKRATVRLQKADVLRYSSERRAKFKYPDQLIAESITPQPPRRIRK